MSSEDEYVYRLGLDYKDFASAANSVLSILGEIDDKLAGTTPRSAKKASEALVDLMRGVQAVGKTKGIDFDSTKAVASLKRQKAQVDELAKSVRDAATGYAKFQTNTARGLQRPGGLQPARLSNAQLQTYSQQGSALAANNVSTTTSQRAFLAAVNAEITGRARAKAATLKARADESAAAEKAYQKAEAAAQKAAAAEIKAAEAVAAAQEKAAARQAEAQAKASARQAAADDQNYRSGLASATRESNARVAAGQKEIEQADKLEAAEKAAAAAAERAQETLRNTGEATGTRTVASSNSQLFTGSGAINPNIGRTYQTAQVANETNSASRNVLSDSDRAASSNQQLASMREFYGAQEKASAAVQRFNQAQQDEYQRQLPRTRYALYDVSNATRIAGTALLASGVSVIATAANYQDLFAQVERTSGILTSSATGAQKNQQFVQLKQDLEDLSKQIPVSFADITKIATLGNQLGIASNNLTSFTQTVAEFSATTDVSVEDSATAFGRLGQLLHNTDYHQIGDQIAYLGVKSVATESDIIKGATQLAVSLQSLNTLKAGTEGAGAQVKETTQATLALATTMAGLGVRPEQARGTFVRAFGIIGQAVASGGKELNDFGRLSGLGAEGFKKDWQAGGTSAYTAFLAFTRGLGSNTAQINGNLASIGITSARDRQSFGLLAQNGTRAIQDLKNAGKGSKNDFLDTAFKAQNNTVLKQLQLLGNQVLAVFDQIGSQTLGPLSFLLDRLKGIVGFLDEIAHNPAQSIMLAIAAAAIILSGGLLLVISGAGRFAANLIALQQIMADTSSEGGLLNGVLNAATGTMTRSGTAAAELTSELVALGLTEEEVALAAANANRTIAASGANTGKAVSGVSKLSSAVGKIGLAGALLSLVILFPTIISGITDMINSMKGATPEVNDLATAVENLGNKKADQAQKTITNGFQAFGNAKKDKGYSYQAQQTVGGYTSLVPVKNDSGTKTITAGQAAANKIGSGQQTLKGQTVGADANVGLAITELQNADAAIAQLYTDGNKKGGDALLKQLRASMAAAGVSAPVLEKALLKTKAALGITGDAAIGAANKVKKTADAEQEAQDASDAFSASLDGLFSDQISASKITKDFTDIGNAIRDNGRVAGLGGSEMETAITDIYASSSDMPTVKGRLQSLYDQLLKLGYQAKDLTGLAGAIGSIPGPTGKATVNLASLTDGLKSNDTATQAATRTIADYGSDLETVFSRSYDLRFGNQTALDTITKGWSDMKDSIKDAREELRKAKADLAALKADRTVTQYQLGVATQFGDTARATVLRAQLAQNNSDIADKQKDVTKDQDATSRKLTGNSAGAIANRSSLLGQVQQGQTYLSTMAKNGASQTQLEAAAAKLKAQFVEQGVQMGFSRKDVEKLAASYDDMKAIIKEVPRNITTKVSAKTGPAKLALAEYNDSLDKINGKTVTTKVVQQAINVADSPLSDPSQVLTPAEQKTLASRQKSQSASLAKKAAQYREGGYTGSAPSWQSAGEVHGDEFVLNSAGYKMFPRQMLEGANHGVAPVIPRISTTATIGSGATMSLGRTERQLLAAAGGAGGGVSVQGARLGSAMDQAWAQGNRRGSN